MTKAALTLVVTLTAILSLAGTPHSLQAQRVVAPNTQVPVSSISERRGVICNPCVIRDFDGGFASISFEDIAPQVGDLRLRYTLRVDPGSTVRAPNGQGGEEIVRAEQLGLAETVLARRVNARVVVTARNPVTGETKRHEWTVSAGSASPTVSIGISGTYWPEVHRRLEEVGNVSAVYNEFDFRVAQVIWEWVDLGGVDYVDSAVRRRLAARERVAQANQQAQAADSVRRLQAADSVRQAAAAAAEAEAEERENRSDAGSTSQADSSGSAVTSGAGQTGTSTSAPTTEAREAAARRGGEEMIESSRRQAESDRARRQAEADAIVAAAAPAVVALASLLGDLLPDGTFATFGFGGLGGTAGTAYFLDGGPGWKITPRSARRHIAISAPSLILGFLGANMGDFTTFHREIGEPAPTDKPAEVAMSYAIGLGGNVYADLPINNTALNVSVYRLWGGNVVTPADDVKGTQGSWIVRSELIRAIPTPRGYRRYGQRWAIGAGVGVQSQRVSWNDSNGSNSRSRLGPFFSLRFIIVDR
jgi:hypothetical protein